MAGVRVKNNQDNQASRARAIKLTLLVLAVVCYSLLTTLLDRASAQDTSKVMPPQI
jgi:hypothetical protein